MIVMNWFFFKFRGMYKWFENVEDCKVGIKNGFIVFSLIWL